MFKRNATIGEIVTLAPQTISFFKEHNIDFCCGGNRPLTFALQERGLDLEASFTQLEQLATTQKIEAVTQNFAAMSTRDLCDYIVAKHHGYLYQTLPQIWDLSLAVMRAHGANHPELFKIGKLFGILRGELNQHLLHEEIILFPALIARDATVPSTLSPEIIQEHEGAGDILVQLRTISKDYTVPADACVSYQLLYKLLAEMEADLHQHIHLENNILLKEYDRR